MLSNNAFAADTHVNCVSLIMIMVVINSCNVVRTIIGASLLTSSTANPSCHSIIVWSVNKAIQYTS